MLTKPFVSFTGVVEKVSFKRDEGTLTISFDPNSLAMQELHDHTGQGITVEMGEIQKSMFVRVPPASEDDRATGGEGARLRAIADQDTGELPQ